MKRLSPAWNHRWTDRPRRWLLTRCATSCCSNWQSDRFRVPKQRVEPSCISEPRVKLITIILKHLNRDILPTAGPADWIRERLYMLGAEVNSSISVTINSETDTFQRKKNDTEQADGEIWLQILCLRWKRNLGRANPEPAACCRHIKKDNYLMDTWTATHSRNLCTCLNIWYRLWRVMKGQLLGRALHKLQALFSAFMEGFGGRVEGSCLIQVVVFCLAQRDVHVQSPHQSREKQPARPRVHIHVSVSNHAAWPCFPWLLRLVRNTQCNMHRSLPWHSPLLACVVNKYMCVWPISIIASGTTASLSLISL